MYNVPCLRRIISFLFSVKEDMIMIVYKMSICVIYQFRNRVFRTIYHEWKIVKKTRAIDVVVIGVEKRIQKRRN